MSLKTCPSHPPPLEKKKERKKEKRATPKWVTKICDNRYDDVCACGWNNIQAMAICLVFTHFGEILTLTFGHGHKHLGHWMRLIGLYLGTKYEVCKWNSIRDMASCLVFYPIWGKFNLDLSPWPLVKVIVTWVIECALLGCTLVPSMKSVGEIVSEIWPVLWFFTLFNWKIWPWPLVKVIGTWVIECAEIWPVLKFFTLC